MLVACTVLEAFRQLDFDACGVVSGEHLRRRLKQLRPLQVLRLIFAIEPWPPALSPRGPMYDRGTQGTPAEDAGKMTSCAAGATSSSPSSSSAASSSGNSKPTSSLWTQVWTLLAVWLVLAQAGLVVFQMIYTPPEKLQHLHSLLNSMFSALLFGASWVGAVHYQSSLPPFDAGGPEGLLSVQAASSKAKYE
eukprot:gnl/TRDRNA2_/TRDRNA2_153945_c1_seq1.p1 gnl/TRDRNA2_/TRDRNA2_153945_c1~~gnl/TRDRNA2_/TRDRNA2_153945_c1_seq1.p1  ORF type:complete len:192 (+),score=42.35 gnl/TRDRNA2_/TRDRNA2_153945_c1_seq1:3-578(+)